MDHLLAERALMEEAARARLVTNLPKTLRFDYLQWVLSSHRASSKQSEAFFARSSLRFMPTVFTTRRRANREEKHRYQVTAD